MKRVLLLAVCLLSSLAVAIESRAELVLLGQFNPSSAGSLCGLAFDQTAGDVWVYGCSAADVQRYSSEGAFLGSVPRPGESANDVDIEFSPVAFTLDTTLVPKGTLLFINGETGVAEVYAVDKGSGAILDTLIAGFGVSHVVGGAYHAQRSTLFLVQDDVPAAADENRIAEINPATGVVSSTFQTTANFAVNFGDVDVCHASRNLLVVSSVEPRIGEFTPAGAFVQYHALPAGVSSLSGIGIHDATGEIWVSGTGGVVWRLGGDVCGSAPTPIPLLPY